ncbi:MAG TPA: hypothetical protein VGQ00_00590 [Candidatus Norongarragalinales archaeon]|jgi:hypothetical protein|nr:hypothetical protein [Candidatus Norongarragalinales archaeon]
MVQIFGIIDFPVTELLLFFNVILFVFLIILTIQLKRLNSIKEDLYGEVRDLRNVMHEYIKSDVVLWSLQLLQAGMPPNMVKEALRAEGYENAGEIVEKAQSISKVARTINKS